MNQDVDPVDLDAQEEAIKKRSAITEHEVQVQQDDIRWIMSTKRGRRIIWRLLDKTGVFRLSFDSNAMNMAFNEGNRNTGNQLLTEITELCPNRFLEMLKEHKEHDRRPGGGKSNR